MSRLDRCLPLPLLLCFGLTVSSVLAQDAKTANALPDKSTQLKPIEATSKIVGVGWKKLADMPTGLGRFELVTDGKTIFRVGGIGFNIRSGQTYGKGMMAFDPAQESWTVLQQVPFGTGGLCVSYWPEKHCLVAIAGIERLGQKFRMDGMTVGIYDISKDSWKVHDIKCKGLGRPTFLIHSFGGKFLVLTSNHGLYKGEKFAELDMDSTSAKVVSNCPIPGRMAAVAKHNGTIFIVQSSRKVRDPKQPRLHQFDVWADQHVSIVELQEHFTHIDSLFIWNEHLMMWKNSGTYDKNKFGWASKLLEINVSTGECSSPYAELPNPQARRSSAGILCGQAFYAFGGQRQDEVWLFDSYRFDFE